MTWKNSIQVGIQAEYLKTKNKEQNTHDMGFPVDALLYHTIQSGECQGCLHPSSSHICGPSHRNEPVEWLVFSN